MLSTFDVSPDTSSDEKEHVEAETTSEVNLEEAGDGAQVAEGNFIDDDFGLSSIRRESEQIKKQQLLIEQEIQRIQQENKVKPPPPYTPPPGSPVPPSGSPVRAVVVRPQPKPKPEKLIPSTRDEIESIVDKLSNALFEAKTQNRENEVDLKAVIMTSEDNEHKKIFIEFLSDLTKEIFDEIFACETAEQNPPWLPQKNLAREIARLPKTASQLTEVIRREVLIHLGFERRAKVENLVVRWSQKRRDRVDQILVRELHAEEAGWTDYSLDEAVIKNQVADSLISLLITDACKMLKTISKRRKNK